MTVTDVSTGMLVKSEVAARQSPQARLHVVPVDGLGKRLSRLRLRRRTQDATLAGPEGSTASRLPLCCVLALPTCQTEAYADSQNPNDTRTANRTQSTHAVVRVLQDIRRTEENTGVGLKNGALAIAGLVTASIWAQKIVRTMP